MKIVDLGTPSKSNGRQIRQHWPVSGVVKQKNVESARICQYKGPPWIMNGVRNLNFGTLKPPQSWFVCDLGPPFCQTQRQQKIYLDKTNKNIWKCGIGRQRLQFWWLFDPPHPAWCAGRVRLTLKSWPELSTHPTHTHPRGTSKNRLPVIKPMIILWANRRKQGYGTTKTIGSIQII